MDDYIPAGGTIDPEVRAHVYSLVSALGGSSSSADGTYVLGDDALGCLKDIKRWLKLHDEKLDRLDVTRCLAEAHLVKGDILEILGQWPEEAIDERWRGRIALACVEILVPLTWPVEKDIMSEVTRNQHRHLPFVQLAQITYKREILEHPSGDILKKVARMALPAMAVPGNERTQRDEGILRLILYFIRNVAMISAAANLPVEWNEQEVSRSATIMAFKRQSIFPVVLTVASNIASDFKTQDVVILEVLFHILKGVDAKKLFMTKPQRSVAAAGELKDLMDREKDLLSTFNRNAPSRHNRFGTMLWIDRGNNKMSTVSGQDMLRDGQQTLEKMDKSKKWNKPKRHPVQDKNSHLSFALPETLTDEANDALRTFVEDFLDSSFNPLFASLRRAIEREADRVLMAHSQQFWYLVSWFLRAESERRKARKKQHEQQQQHDQKQKSKEGQKSTPPLELDSFAIVASVLNQETFILLNRYMQTGIDNKEWPELEAGMRCFTQILLTVQEMAESPLDEDQEIADNIQNNIFYEESTHDRVLAILRGCKDQGFSYLDAATELSHVFLRLLERYSKENGDLQIRSRRRARQKKRKAKNNTKDTQADASTSADANDAAREDNTPEQDASEAEDEAQATRISRERKFDFNRFALKFTTQASVNTFAKFLSYHKDLSTEQLKRAHRFFYRVAFKQELSVLLFRMDIIQLLFRLIRGQGDSALHRTNPMFGEWAELVKQVFRRLVRKMKERPELAVELLFSKIPATCHYLEYGYEKQTISSAPRAPAELEVKGGLPIDEQIGVVVAVLVGEDKSELVGWVAKTLRDAAGERQAWEGLDEARAAEKEATEGANASSATPEAQIGEEGEGTTAPSSSDPPPILISPDSTNRKITIFKDGKLRLLLKLVGAERIGFRDDPDATWSFPPSLTSSQLFEFSSIVEQHRLDPKTSYGESDDSPVAANDMLKRVPASRANRADVVLSGEGEGEGYERGLNGFLDDDDEEEEDGEEFLFPAGGPTARKSDVLEELKQKRRLQRKPRNDDETVEIDPEVLRQRTLARREHELEKRRKIKSTEFVHESDDESDEEKDKLFFEREKRTATERARKHDAAFEAEKKRMMFGVEKKGKRKRNGGEEQTEEEDRAKKLRSSDDEADMAGSSEDESDEEALFVSDGRMKKQGKKVTARVETDLTSEPDRTVDDGSSASNGDSGNESDADITPLSSQSEPRVGKLALVERDVNRGQDKAGPVGKMMEIGGEDEDDDEAVLPVARGRARLVVLDDSDDE